MRVHTFSVKFSVRVSEVWGFASRVQGSAQGGGISRCRVQGNVGGSGCGLRVASSGLGLTGVPV